MIRADDPSDIKGDFCLSCLNFRLRTLSISNINLCTRFRVSYLPVKIFLSITAKVYFESIINW